jgi:hypothetical protein
MTDEPAVGTPGGDDDRSRERAGDERPEDQFYARVTVTREQAAELLRRGLDFGDRPHVSPNPDGTGDLDLFLTQGQIDGLRADGFAVEMGPNLSARARERLAEVGQGDRFEGGRTPPRGLGQKIGGRLQPGGGEPGGGEPGGGEPGERPERAP